MKIIQSTNKKQAGFSLIEAAVLALVAVLIVGVGWFAYQHNKPKTGNATSDTGQSTTTPPITGEPGPTKDYLEIKEWGVKVPLSEPIKDAYYVVGDFSDAPDGKPGGMYVSLHSLTSKACNPENNNHGRLGAIGSMHRVLPTTTDAVTGELLMKEYPGGTTINDYYYFYQGWTDSNSCASTSVLKELSDDFAASAGGIIPASKQ